MNNTQALIKAAREAVTVLSLSAEPCNETMQAVRDIRAFIDSIEQKPMDELQAETERLRLYPWQQPTGGGEEERCKACGWPIVADGEAGCWASNCSMRPIPTQPPAQQPQQDVVAEYLRTENAKPFPWAEKYPDDFTPAPGEFVPTPDTRHERANEVLREGLVIADELLEGLGARLPYVECAKIKDTLARADAILKGEE